MTDKKDMNDKKNKPEAFESDFMALLQAIGAKADAAGVSAVHEKRYGLIGGKISHSLSKKLHAQIGGYVYDLIEVRDPSKLGSVVKSPAYDGFNVTIPYKQDVIPMLDDMSDEARVIGAVNTIRRLPDGSLKGYNTDCYGFKRMFAPGAVEGRKVLVLGTGGASLAVRKALADMGAASVLSVSRHPEGEEISYADIKAHTDAQIIVNATPVGMFPNNGVSPLDGVIELAEFKKLEIVADLIYNPYRTKILQDAEACGADTISGLTMLVWQGIYAKEIWLEGDEATEQKTYDLNADLAQKVIHKMLTDQLNIVTVGMPGSGKSSISRQLALHLKKPFADTDRAIEEVQGKVPGELIKKLGEPAFRDIETEMVGAICKNAGQVIATGGGAVIRPENRMSMRENGVVVYIKRPVEQLSVKNRPLSQSQGVEALFEQRSPMYDAAADIEILNDKTFGKGITKNARKALKNKSYKTSGPQSFYIRDIRTFAKWIAKDVNKYIDGIAAHDAAGAGRK